MIKRAPCPKDLTEWRKANEKDVNYGYKLLPKELANIVLTSLVAEQRGLCAYTGIAITPDTAHIEHIYPQKHCSIDEQTRYENLAACTPPPNQKSKLPFGAQFKDSWPSEAELSQFVTPYSQNCDRRFVFTLRGRVEASKDDAAAATTIEKLGLDHPALQQRRLRTINSVIGVGKKIKLNMKAKDLRNRLAKLEASEHGNDRLEEFCSTLLQVIPKRLLQVEAIRQSKGKKK